MKCISMLMAIGKVKTLAGDVGGGEAYSFVARPSHLTIDHKNDGEEKTDT